MYYLGLATVFILDRLSKILIIRNFSLFQSVPVIKNIFHLTYVRNPGALWGMLPGALWLFLPAGVLILAGLTYFERTVPKNQELLRLGLGLLAGATLGNLFDRLVYGSVIDFLDFRFWPVFNLADTFTNVGIFIIIVLTLVDSTKKEGR